MTLRRSLLLAPLAIAAAFLVWAHDASVASRGAAAPLPEAPAIRWEQGAHQAYTVTTEATMETRLAAGKPLRMEARLSGVLDLQVVDAKGARGRFRLAPASYGAAGGPDRAQEIGLSLPFEVRFDRAGRPVRFDFPSTMPPEGRFVLEQLIRTFQVVTGRGTSWTAHEQNGMGRYVASYRTTDDGSIVKEKLCFEEVSARTSGLEGPLEVQLPRSEAIVRLSASASWVESVAVRERMRVVARGERVMDSTLDASLTRLASVPAPPPPAASRAAVARSRIADPNAEMSRLLDGVESTGGTAVESAHGVRDLLTVCPETAGIVRAAIAKADVGDAAASALVNALQLAGTPEAQEALGAILEGADMSRMNRLRAAIALGGVAEPAPEAIESLWRSASDRADEDARERAHTALLALGALAPAARGDGTSLGTVERGLVARLAAASDEDEKGVLLKALGNARTTALVPTVVPYLEDPSVYVRSSAADALGNMADAATEAALVARLGTETDPRVRAAAAASLNRVESPSLSSLEAVLAMVRGEEDDTTRLDLSRFLGEHLAAIPEARATFDLLLRKDRSKRVRSYAARVLLRS